MALDTAGWTYEGIGWIGADSGDPVYRLYNPNAKGGDHYYTKNYDEAASLVRLGWRWDNNGKPLLYSNGDTPLYVAYNPNAESGAHNYTTNRMEQENLLFTGWKYDEIAWGVVGEGQPAQKDFSIFARMPENMIFVSGAGGPSNQLQINNDGTFTGYYSESGIGQITDCSYTGKFTAAIKVNEYSYTAKLESLKLDRPAGQRWIDSKGVTHISTVPGGTNKNFNYLKLCEG